jgi:molybdate transport repressor ModE-like protein
MGSVSKPRPAFKVWLETEEGYVFGPGVYTLLRKVKETGTLKEAAKRIGMSYRYAWGLVKRAEEKLEHPLLRSHKGGKSGGGGAELTETGQQFIDDFSKMMDILANITKEGLEWEVSQTKNEVEGRVTELSSVNERFEITLRLKKSTQLRLVVPEKMMTEGEIICGDQLNVTLTPIVNFLEKKRD